MKLLADTHAVAWWLEGSDDLSEPARRALGDETNLVFVSAVSIYEISLKHRLGKWPEAGALLQTLPRFMAAQGVQAMPLTFEHANLAGSLPPTHRDPFDRMLAGQALTEHLTIVSIDHLLDQFGVSRLW